MPQVAQDTTVNAADVLCALVFIGFLLVMYCAVYFVSAAFAATGTGLILWGEGWEALKEHIWNL